MVVTIVGIGLIGGSLTKSLRANGFASELIGVDTNTTHCEQALELRLVDRILPIEEAITASELIILAVPVNNAREILPSILDQLKGGQIVTDMGSTKKGICNKVANHINRQQYVAAHPIAGTEFSGPQAAISDLFLHKVTIICDSEKSSQQALQSVEGMFRSLFMRIAYMSSEAHDKHIAYVSHLSHISSFTLGLTVLEIEKNEKNIFNMAGSGFASTVRLAKSSPDMWAPIFEQNAENLSVALEAYINQLTRFKSLIDEGQTDEAHALMKDANEIRRILEGIELDEKG